ncbi:MAG: amidohydrolase family protein, partial [Chloroflexota bacterium]
MTSLLIHNGLILPCDSDTRTAIPRGYVFVQDDRIAAVGADDAPPAFLAEAATTIDARGKVVIPGLINAHTHLFQTFMRGLADDKPLLRWLEAAIWPGALAMTEEDFYLAALIGFVENL